MNPSPFDFAGFYREQVRAANRPERFSWEVAERPQPFHATAGPSRGTIAK
jgi:hypothetical protein